MKYLYAGIIVKQYFKVNVKYGSWPGATNNFDEVKKP